MYYMYKNCGLGRFLKPIVNPNFCWQHGHICVPHSIFFINTTKITAILVSRSPGDTVTLGSLESRCVVEGFISSKYDSLKVSHFSHAPNHELNRWCYILYPQWFARCWPYNLLPGQSFCKHEFWGQYSKSHWNTIVVKIIWTHWGWVTHTCVIECMGGHWFS